MNYIKNAFKVLSSSTDGSPVSSVLVVMLFYVFFNILEASIETLIWGDRFDHILDPFFIIAFMGMSAYSVYACAEHNTKEMK